MSEDKIKNNPSLKKLSDDAKDLENIKKIWPILKPFARLFGGDTKSVDEAFAKMDHLIPNTNEIVEVPDKFNNIFAEQGWILFEVMEVDTAKEAISISEKLGIELADEYLVEHFSPQWFRDRINWLKFIKGFESRFPLALKALEDYEAGRYYSTIQITLSLIDGWVNDLNIVNFQRQGFFSENSQLVAYDSITAHPNGLMRLKETFNRSRQATRIDEIKIPYRNGIVHGMDLGYDNKYVAAKCWAALFAVRDWAIKVAKNELKAPENRPEVERTIWESLEKYNDTRKKIEEYKKWQPRVIVIGETIPANGKIEQYPENSPERKIVEFLNYWVKNNYGFMAKCRQPLFDFAPVPIKDIFGRYTVDDYSIIQVLEITPTVADIDVKVRLLDGADVKESDISFRVVGVKSDGNLADFLTEDMVWCISIWRINL